MPFGFLKKKGDKERTLRRPTHLNRTDLRPHRPIPPSTDILGRIKELSAEGVSEPDIMRTLRAEGNSPLDIDRAMRTFVRTGVETPEFPVKERPTDRRRPPERDDEFGLPEIPGREVRRVSHEERPIISKSFDKREIEELIEETVAEKSKELDTKLNDFFNQIKTVDSRVEKLERRLNDLAKEKQKDVKNIEGKIDDYKGSMDNISARMEGMKEAIKDMVEALKDKKE